MAAAAIAVANEEEEDDQSKKVYQVKWIGFNGKKCPIVTQNENGPCLLLSIVNVMLLRGVISLPDASEIVASDKLMTLLGNKLCCLTPPQRREELGNFEQNVSDAMAVLPKLQTGK